MRASTEMNERKQAEKAIKGEGDNIQRYLDIAGVMLVIVNAHQKVSFINKRGCEILGWEEAEIIGKNWFNTFIPKRIKDEAKAVFEKLMAEGEIDGVEYRETPVLTKCGEERLIAWRNTVLADKVGKIIGTIYLGEDITEHKKLEHSLNERVKELQCLHGIAEIREKSDITSDEIYSEVLNLICAAWQYPDITCARITINNKSFKTQDFRETKWRLSSCIEVDGERAGEMMVCYLEERPELDEGPFLREERLLLNTVAERLGRIAERLQIEEAVQNSERLYRSLFQEANEGIFLHDVAGNVTMANRAIAELTGYTVDELTNMNVSKWLSAPSFETITEIQKNQLDGKAAAIGQRYQLQMIRKDGEKRTIEVATRLLTSRNSSPISQSIVRDITKEKQISENIRAYANKVVEAQEEERRRIARELHDETAQALVSLGMDIDSLIKTKWQLSEDIVKHLEELRNRINDIFQGVRYLSRALRPPMLEELGLLEALRCLSSDVADQYGITVHCKVLGTPRRLTPETELMLFRIAQEALSNVGKHARATEALVQIEFSVERVKLLISDNGQGFELPQGTDVAAFSGKMGLLGMQERARLVDGTLKVQSGLGKGTTLTLEVLR